jgi:hypothetical protein
MTSNPTSLRFVLIFSGSWGSSVSLVSGYRRDEWSSILAEAKEFSSSLCVQNSSEAHPASCTMGTGVLSPGVKRGRGVTLNTLPHLLTRSRMSRSYTWAVPWLRQSPASHRGGPGSCPGQSMWDLWWTEWHWDRFFTEFFDFPPSIS